MKKFFTVAIVFIALAAADIIYVNAKTTNAEVVPVVSGVNVHVTGNDDGHCHYCGPKNARISGLRVDLPQRHVSAVIPNVLMLTRIK